MNPWHVVSREGFIETRAGFDTRDEAEGFAKNCGPGYRAVMLADVTPAPPPPPPKLAWLVTFRTGLLVAAYEDEASARIYIDNHKDHYRLFKVTGLEEVEP